MDVDVAGGVVVCGDGDVADASVIESASLDGYEYDAAELKDHGWVG